MTSLSEIYNTRILELAAEIGASERLSAPHGSATAHSKLCGSTVSCDVQLEGDVITAYGQTVKACLLGQASASVVGREVVGSTVGDVHAVAAAMREMLKAGGPGPDGRWADLAILAPVRDYKARHASTLLVFDALEKAIAAAQATATNGAMERVS